MANKKRQLDEIKAAIGGFEKTKTGAPAKTGAAAEKQKPSEGEALELEAIFGRMKLADPDASERTNISLWVDKDLYRKILFMKLVSGVPVTRAINYMIKDWLDGHPELEGYISEHTPY